MSSADAGRPVPGSPRVHEVAPDDVADVQRVLESDPDYAIALTGYPPGPSDALSSLMMEPDGFAGTKYAFGLWIDRELVAFADVLRAHPGAATLSIGLLLVVPDRRRQGLGTALHDGIVERAAAWDGIDRIRLGVVQAAAAGADPFWATLGYRRTAESAPYRYDHVVSTVRLWTRPLRSRDSAGDPARRRPLHEGRIGGASAPATLAGCPGRPDPPRATSSDRGPRWRHPIPSWRSHGDSR